MGAGLLREEGFKELFMARYIEAVCRLCRREGVKLFLKGTRCVTDKCSVSKRSYSPGQHGQARVKLSDYGLQLREKQKVKRIYGILEKHFRHLFEIASKSKGITGEMLLQLLERRLDNVIFRLGFAVSRANARQIVKHGFVYVNNKRVDIPSFLVKKDDIIQIKTKNEKFLNKIAEMIELTKDRGVSGWLEVDDKNFSGKVVRLPQKEDVGFPIREQLIVELYSK